MKKHSHHIALMLLLFIAYPFVFQALHVLYHDHSHTAVNWSANSGNYDACSSHDHSDSPNSTKNNPDASPLSDHHIAGIPDQPEHDHEHCPLCEHEFAKFSVISPFNITFKDERFSLVNNYFYKNPSVLYTGYHRSLRAPPAGFIIT